MNANTPHDDFDAAMRARHRASLDALTPATRRALQGALAEARARSRPAGAGSRPWALPAGGVAIAVAVIALVLTLRPSPPASGPAPVAGVPRAAPAPGPAAPVAPARTDAAALAQRERAPTGASPEAVGPPSVADTVLAESDAEPADGAVMLDENPDFFLWLADAGPSES
ncbi:hypothetical protein ACFOED_13690 [Vulcaniibacterium thermophilum]|uniref:Uncharacterized protein n=3 Tax=Vulcaniibacterium thermophilum TaxID=1169913 RepID=A0A918Z1R7_9GAMM|nr:hypothetical protein [Vulcaniibacterium thermophilum]GHE32361.1 hypothetical protein GCM10007167_12820 [Vulcaniibacterium thermophilum]